MDPEKGDDDEGPMQIRQVMQQSNNPYNSSNLLRSEKIYGIGIQEFEDLDNDGGQ